MPILDEPCAPPGYAVASVRAFLATPARNWEPRLRLHPPATIAGLIALGPQRSAGDTSGPTLLPDLVVESPDDVVLERPRGSERVFLRFSHSTANIGGGPLEIYPDLETNRCGDQGTDAAGSPTRRSTTTPTRTASSTVRSTQAPPTRRSAA